MRLNDMPSFEKGGARKRRRVGRGIASGHGKTAGRGQKGYKSRSGSAVGTFEGGQTPLHMRLPKRGFSNRRFAKQHAILNLGRLDQWIKEGKIAASETITPKRLFEVGLLRDERDSLRLLAKGDLSQAITIEAHGVSAKAKERIEAAGGRVILKVREKVSKAASRKNAAPDPRKRKREARQSAMRKGKAEKTSPQDEAKDEAKEEKA